MKKLLSIAALLISLSVSAQGNLQFNQVRNYNLTGISTGGGSKDFQNIALTVPAGKVWKVESASCRLQRDDIPNIPYGGNTGNKLMIILDEVPIAHMFLLSGWSNSNNELPLWLSAGSHSLDLKGYINEAGPLSAYGKVSIIEFNVVP